ncbi:alpha/beta fold hydrolase [Roseivirga sp. BDSF3-8]|uniref:alpha/beta fold hydrolase n=1 Tax=Roseivirga sp. BDSF3-8 TaxID=3241598 RepID=UPI0035318608
MAETLHFKEMGEGKPLVIFHGLFGSSDNWVTVGRELAKTFQVYLVDMRNHGDSPHQDVHTYESMAEDILQFLDDQKLERPFIIGHSMGGKAAMNFAVRHPDRFEKLIIVDIAPKAYPVHHRTILDGLMGIDVANLESRQEADKQLAKSIPEKPVRQFLLKNLDRDKEGEYSWKLNLAALDANLETIGAGMEEHYTTDKPVLFIRGEKSNYIQDQDSIAIVALFPNSSIETIKGAGHWVHAEKPQEFVELVTGFIQSPS